VDGKEYRKVQVRWSCPVYSEHGGIRSVCGNALRRERISGDDADRGHQRRNFSDGNRNRFGSRSGVGIVNRAGGEHVSAVGHVRPDKAEYLFLAGWWRLNELDRHSTQQLVLTVATEMARLYKARMSIPFWLSDSQTDWTRYLRDVAHHMGTTRMADSEQKGVVDADCRVFGVPNLYVAGSSVFPTGGQANPTLTIVALALRLADHLKSKLA